MQETFLTEFENRGYLSQCTDRSSLDELISKSKIKGKKNITGSQINILKVEKIIKENNLILLFLGINE